MRAVYLSLLETQLKMIKRLILPSWYVADALSHCFSEDGTSIRTRDALEVMFDKVGYKVGIPCAKKCNSHRAFHFFENLLQVIRPVRLVSSLSIDLVCWQVDTIIDRLELPFLDVAVYVLERRLSMSKYSLTS
jgi:hypothetical protein